MSAKPAPLKVVFLWHQHQPYYKDFETDRYVLPWVRLHGTKDYLDMVRILDEFPGIKQTFNLVPSLIEQIQDYTQHDAVDNHMSLTLKRAADLTDAEKIEILSTFFSANVGTMIKPHQRYYQIHEKVMLCKSDLQKAADSITDQEYIDLTIWSNLVWIDPMFRSDPDIARLFEKKNGFSEEDKIGLFQFQKRLLSEIIPAHRDAQDRGQIEVSFSPYFHPILPLLIDTDLAREALPRIKLPSERFQHPEDASHQIKMSCDMYQELFGRPLTGMWPSEGSVAEPLIPLFLDHNVKWIATDEDVLFESADALSKADAGTRQIALHRPYRLKRDSGELGILFRNHALSDKIGFVYSGWDPEKAAHDFVSSLLDIRKSLGRENLKECVVPIILDGENAWEYYKNDGVDFIRALYSNLSKDDKIETITVSEAFAAVDKPQNLPRLFAGSWINHDFRVWIGHDEDNKAWDFLSRARNALVEYERVTPEATPETLKQAWKEIFIAEGSDWCWWYGDDHSSNQDDIFDSLFRSHLLAVYKLIEKDPPEELLQPIRGIRGVSGIEQPLGLVSPTVDGLVTTFYEWHDSGMLDCMKAGSAMHRAINVVHAFHFGFDDDNIYFRLDLFTRAEDDAAAEFEFQIELKAARDYVITVKREGTQIASRELNAKEYIDNEFKGQVALKKVLEVSIPRSEIAFDKEFRADLAVEVVRRSEQIERWPAYDMIHTTMPTRNESTFWQV
ncbi:MAG: glycoside hydrolase [candidate division Zixibacteria bacterium]|nr:glycoside hydrolase [candidate division Zixibacteria bacterium]MBU1470378.1 glycoside hydrolase [candidate division Zixibacteria bacterium]MBU2624894.1 glycoside hydrolase [candidate division Zixibacteria bacterium]